MKSASKSIFVIMFIFSLQNCAHPHDVLYTMNGKPLVVAHEVTKKYESVIKRLNKLSEKMEPDLSVVLMPKILKYFSPKNILNGVMIMKALAHAVKESNIEKQDDILEVIKSLVAQIQNKFTVGLEDEELGTLLYVCSAISHFVKVVRTHPHLAQAIEKISDQEVHSRVQNINNLAEGLFGLEGISQAQVEKVKFTIKILIAARNPEYEKEIKQILERETKKVAQQFHIKTHDENIQRYLQEQEHK